MRQVKIPLSAKLAVHCSLPPSEARAVISQVETWLRCSGVEWTVGRLKAIRTAALNLKSSAAYAPGLQEKGHIAARQLYRDNGISYRKCSLIPTGIYGVVVDRFVHGQRPAVVKRLDVVLRLYTCFRLPELSDKQFNKSKRSINEPPAYNAESLARAKELVSLGWSYFKEILSEREYFNDSGVRLVPKKVGTANLSKLHPWTQVHSSVSIHNDLDFRSKPYGKWIESFMSCTFWPKAFRTNPEEGEKGLYPFEIFSFIRSMVFHRTVDNNFVGRILFLQEAGAKARIVACPSAILQWAFQPLHDYLDRIIRALQPWFAVHDQDNGAYTLMRVLGDHMVGCIDLSSATDRFPRGLQTHLLEIMGLGKWADALDELCEEPWLVQCPDGHSEEWFYRTGQPMGLYSSFPLFSLTYGSLVMGIYLSLLRDHKLYAEILCPEDAFRDVGDDMIVVGKEMIEELTATLSSLGCQVAPEKSFESAKLGEFAGFIAYSSNQGAFAYRPYKFGSGSKIMNGVSFISSVGSGIKYLSSSRGRAYWTLQLERYNSTKQWRHPSLTPMIPLGSDHLVPNEELTSVTRLANLLTFRLSEEGYGDSWSHEPFSLESVEELCCTLLAKEYTTYLQELEDQIVVEGEKPRYEASLGSRDLTIRHDPLLKKDLPKWLSSPSEDVLANPNEGTTCPSLATVDMPQDQVDTDQEDEGFIIPDDFCIDPDLLR